MQLLDENQVKGLIKKIPSNFFLHLFVIFLSYWLQDRRDTKPFIDSTQVKIEN